MYVFMYGSMYGSISYLHIYYLSVCLSVLSVVTYYFFTARTLDVAKELFNVQKIIALWVTSPKKGTVNAAQVLLHILKFKWGP